MDIGQSLYPTKDSEIGKGILRNPPHKKSK